LLILLVPVAGQLAALLLSAIVTTTLAALAVWELRVGSESGTLNRGVSQMTNVTAGAERLR
jgi:hypothetical protein